MEAEKTPAQRARLEAAFGVSVPAAATRRQVLDACEARGAGHVEYVVALDEFRAALNEGAGIPPEYAGETTRLSALIPTRGRRSAWERIRDASWLRFPPLGVPVWLQHLLGLALIAGIVLPIFFLLPGLLTFIAAIAATLLTDRYLAGFPFPTVGKCAQRIAQLNFQALDTDRPGRRDLERIYDRILADEGQSP